MYQLMIGLIAFVVARPTFAMQGYDWPNLLRDLNSKDSSVQAPAQKLLSGTVLPELSKREPDQLEKDIAAIMRVGQQDESLRFAATTTINVLGLGIRDTAKAFSPILPAVLTQFRDPNVRVRQTAISLVANLRPDVPELAIRPFIDALQDTDAQTAGFATVGLARLCRYPEAAKAIGALLKPDQSKAVRLRAIAAIGPGKCADPDVLAALGTSFDERDREVVQAAIRSASQLGSAGQVFRTQLDRLAQSKADPEIARAAAAALAKLP